MASYGASQRRSRAGLQMMRYRRQGGYPIVTRPIGDDLAIYANPMVSYGSPQYSDKGWAFLVPLFSAGASAVSNHLLAQDAQAANAQAQANAQQIAAAEAANKPFLYMAGAFVLGAGILAVVAIVR